MINSIILALRRPRSPGTCQNKNKQIKKCSHHVFLNFKFHIYSIYIFILTRKYLQADVGAPRVKSFPPSGGLVDGSSASSSRGHPLLRFRPDVRSTSAAASMPPVSSILRSVPLVELFVQPMARHVLRRGGSMPFR